MMKPHVFACAVVILLSATAHRASCAPVNFWFEKANKLYEQQAYDSAAYYYEQVLESGTTNAAVYFNLGNSFFRLKKVGLALLNYEKARRLSPNDPDILANIRYANSAIIDRLPQPEQSFIEAVMFRVHTLLPLSTQLWILLSLCTALCVLFSLGLYVSPNARLWIIYLSSLLVLLTVVVGTSAGIKIYNSERAGYAIVLTPSLDAKNQPNGNKVLFTVHEGTKFRVRKHINEWSLVSLPTGVSGWVLTSSLGKI
jgi:tetratricopeptide (TPR) repeat protein